jgi:hypothetical protein
MSRDSFHSAAEQLERQAGRIAHPVERLRFLRKHAPAQSVQPLPLRLVEAQPVRFSTWPGPKYYGRRILGGAFAVGLAVVGFQFWARDSERAQGVAVETPPSPGPAAGKVWLVESSATEEVYSNGLRIRLEFATRHRPRAQFPIYAWDAGVAQVAVGRQPRGIVYHTTESDLAPFEEAAGQRISALTHMLLRFVRRERSYHYLIDRFGRVYRVVEETDAANHAGFSVWGDEDGVYMNLNDSFLGVAFEGSTQRREGITAAQVAAARALTEMLRMRYKIRGEDCVTHAQVSVNPATGRIGNHLDWARGFPFAALDLPDNYQARIPAVEVFGFAHDRDVTRAAGGQDWPGLAESQRRLRAAAAEANAGDIRYRGMLRHRYQEILAEWKQREAARQTEEN